MMIKGSQKIIEQLFISNLELRSLSNECFKLEQASIIDERFSYDLPYMMKTYLVILSNVVHVPSVFTIKSRILG